MKIQISPTKKIKDALSIWHKAGPEVDLVIDPRKDGLPFRENTIQVIYALNILGLSKHKNIPAILNNFYKLLKHDGELYIVEQDFDYINRAYISGDLPIREFNERSRKQSYINGEELARLLKLAGFSDKNMRFWYGGLKFKKEDFELVMSAKKQIN